MTQAVKRAAFAFKKKRNLQGKKRKKHKLGSVVDQIMRKRREEQAAEGNSKPATKSSDKVQVNFYLDIYLPIILYYIL